MGLSCFLITGYATTGFCHAIIQLVLQIATPSLMRLVIIHVILVDHPGNLGTLETGRTHAMPSFIEAFVIHISERMLREKELCYAARFEKAGLALVLQTKSSVMVLHE